MVYAQSHMKHEDLQTNFVATRRKPSGPRFADKPVTFPKRKKRNGATVHVRQLRKIRFSGFVSVLFSLSPGRPFIVIETNGFRVYALRGSLA